MTIIFFCQPTFSAHSSIWLPYSVFTCMLPRTVGKLKESTAAKLNAVTRPLPVTLSQHPQVPPNSVHSDRPDTRDHGSHQCLCLSSCERQRATINRVQITVDVNDNWR